MIAREAQPLRCYTRARVSSTSTVRITLVRHGESLSNRTQRWQGHGDSPLSELGTAQARAVALRLGERHFDRIIASDLERASATARALGRPFERDAGFREFDIGAWEGLTREEVAEKFPEELERLAAGEDVRIGGGESYASFCARVDHTLSGVRAALLPGQHALVVCHGGVIGALVAGALGLRGVRELPLSRPFNTSITEIAYDATGGATLRVFNDSLHLAELALFPHPVEMLGALALICDAPPATAFGTFGAHYDCERELAELAAAQASREPSLRALIDSARLRHPDQRVAFTALAPRIHGWAGELVFRGADPIGALAIPESGMLAHVNLRDDQLALIDYGVSHD